MSIEIRRLPLIAMLALTAALPARAEQPLSAIDWLSQSVSRPPAPPATDQPRPAAPVEIGVAPLPGTNADAAGLVDADRAELPRDFWGITPSAELARLIAAQPVDALPAANETLFRILLAELNPPVDSDGNAALFLARIDKLMDLGATEQALALLDREGADTPQSFRRWFDLSLLAGQEDRTCPEMLSHPSLAPGLAARVFCLGRGEDWAAAMTTLQAGLALGEIDAYDGELLTRFLEPEMAEESAPLAPPSRPTPLQWRLFEAVGEAIPSGSLPLAFATADLRNNTGWKARIEAGERLARTGALDPNALHGLYTEQRAAASGGVWDRVRIVQQLDTALTEAEAGDTGPLSLILPQGWDLLAQSELEVPLSAMFGDRVVALTLEGEAAATAYRMGLLTDAYAKNARVRAPDGAMEAFLKGVAAGSLRGVVPPDRMAGAVRDGLRADAVPADLKGMLDWQRRGEAVMNALLRVRAGASGDLRAVTEGLATLRAVGLEDDARRIGLQLILLDRRG